MENVLEEDESRGRKSGKEVIVVVQVWNVDDRNSGSGSESLLGGAQLRSRFRSHQQTVEFGKMTNGENLGMTNGEKTQKGEPWDPDSIRNETAQTRKKIGQNQEESEGQTGPCIYQ